MHDSNFKTIAGTMVFLFVAPMLFLLACGDGDKSAGELKVRSVGDRFEYSGGLFKVWVHLPEAVDNAEQIQWRTGAGKIAKRSQSEGEKIIADTAWLHWEKVPPLIITEVGDSSDIQVDSSYIDSIAVIVDDVASPAVAVEIFNILPDLDSVLFDGRSEDFNDSMLTLSANPGATVNITLTMKDALVDKDPVFLWPNGFGEFTSAITDSGISFIWKALEEAPVDTVVEFVITDTGGKGKRTYKLHLIVYRETGTLWVGADGDLVKLSSSGSELFRLTDLFENISDLKIIPSISPGVWVADQSLSILARISRMGTVLYSDSTQASQPLAISVDAESGFLWVADRSPSTGVNLLSRIRRFDVGGGGDSLSVLATFDSLQGPVTSFSMNQYEKNMLWFTSSEGDYVGLVRDTAVQIFSGSPYYFNRPRAVSYDADFGLAWIADSSRVIVLDSAGDIQATISGFSFVSGLSAAAGVCWISDVGGDRVVKFDRKVSGSRKVTDGVVVDGFQGPTGLATDPSTKGCWVTDTQAGKVVKIDSEGKVLLEVKGLSLPSKIVLNQVYR